MEQNHIILLTISILFGIFSLIDLFFCYKQNEIWRKIAKLPPLIILIIGAIILFPNEYLIYLGLIFGTIGDAFLISQNKKFLFIGMLFFLAQHLTILSCFTLTFNVVIPYYSYIIIFACLAIFIVCGHFVLKNKISWPFKIVGGTYIFSLLTNAFFFLVAAIILKNPMISIISIGYFIFLSSDTFLFFKRFIKRYKNDEVYVMSTYYLAQYLILIFFALTIL